MPPCDLLIRNACVVDGSGADPRMQDVAVRAGYIVGMGSGETWTSAHVFDAAGQTLSPGFIDSHTHDDLSVIRAPEMYPKLTQGVTTVVVGNCGISASPVTLRGNLPDPMNLLGDSAAFRYPTFASYVAAVAAAAPVVNVAALVGHTALRSNHMDRLDRVATNEEIRAMRTQLTEALDGGALGLSTGLAYASAIHATTDEVLQLAAPLPAYGAVYVSHIRSESAAIREALAEALAIGRNSSVRVVISHLKCAGIDNWGRSEEILRYLDTAPQASATAWDCYPYAASSSTLDLRQVDPRIRIRITWSESHPEMAGRLLSEIADGWSISQVEAADRLQPAGAIYFGMSEDDVRRILLHPSTMIGSDGLPNDPRPHPRLWGTFPRVLGHYSRDLQLMSLAQAVAKMTGAPARAFGLDRRGLLREGYAADMVLFDADRIEDRATFDAPQQPSIGIRAVWVNGMLALNNGEPTGGRGGRFLTRTTKKEVER